MRVSEALEKAADAIERMGHAASCDEVLQGRHCIISACREVTEGAESIYEPVLDMVRSNLAPVGIVMWSNTSTEDEVIERLRKVAAEARWSEVDA